MVVSIDVAADRINWVSLSDDGKFGDGDACPAEDLGRLVDIVAAAVAR